MIRLVWKQCCLSSFIWVDCDEQLFPCSSISSNVDYAAHPSTQISYAVAVCVCFLFVCLFWNTGAIATTKDVCVFISHVYLLFFTVLPSARRVNQSSNVAKIQPCSKSLLLIQNDLAKNFGQLQLMLLRSISQLCKCCMGDACFISFLLVNGECHTQNFTNETKSGVN